MKRFRFLSTRLFLLLFLFITATLTCSLPVSAKNLRVGLFIGTFDPFHAQHAELALKAKAELGLDAVFVVPNSSNPKKTMMTSLSFRHRLIAAALRDIHDPALFLLSKEDIKAADRSNNQTLFAYNIISLLKKRFSGATLYEILGSDSVEKVFNSGMPKPADKVVLVVMVRPKTTLKEQPLLTRFKQQGLFVEITPGKVALSSTEIRSAAKGGNIEFLRTHLSPSLYRELVFRGSYGLRQTLAWRPEVLRLIHEDRNHD